MPTLDCSTGKAISVFPVSQATAKNKDGNGNKRKNRANSVSEQVEHVKVTPNISFNTLGLIRSELKIVIS